MKKVSPAHSYEKMSRRNHVSLPTPTGGIVHLLLLRGLANYHFDISADGITGLYRLTVRRIITAQEDFRAGRRKISNKETNPVLLQP